MYLKKQYIVQPYSVGKEKRSLAMILPSAVVRWLKIDPMDVLFFLKVTGINELTLKVLREDELQI